MPIDEIVFQLIVEIVRAALVEELSERVRRIRIRRLNGIEEVRRHIYRRTSRQLLDRLSTEFRWK
jgi:hypothetical protein